MGKHGSDRLVSCKYVLSRWGLECHYQGEWDDQDISETRVLTGDVIREWVRRAVAAGYDLSEPDRSESNVPPMVTRTDAVAVALMRRLGLDAGESHTYRDESVLPCYVPLADVGGEWLWTGRARRNLQRRRRERAGRG